MQSLNITSLWIFTITWNFVIGRCSKSSVDSRWHKFGKKFETKQTKFQGGKLWKWAIDSLSVEELRELIDEQWNEWLIDKALPKKVFPPPPIYVSIVSVMEFLDYTSYLLMYFVSQRSKLNVLFHFQIYFLHVYVERT